MSRYHSYLNSAREILASYPGTEPFASYLKKYFSQNKKFGSKDRKHVSHLCYCFFRLGKAMPDLSVEERILAGLFLCERSENEILESLKPGWNKNVKESLEEKYSILELESYPANLLDVFPWADELSAGIDHRKFCESFFIQPDLFLRLRPGKKEVVIRKLQNAGIEFQNVDGNCLSLPNGSKIETVIELNKEAVVQDHSSQQTGDFLQLAVADQERTNVLWDCCAASGGKSIMAKDRLRDIKLVVSDIRESILLNLKKRFSEAGITKYESFVADLAAPGYSPGTSIFDIIICDAPCSGSGTWSRNPEQLYYFEKDRIAHYVSLQKSIVGNIIPALKPGGYLLYITCSVFRKENEDIVEFIENGHHLEVIKMGPLKGYDKKADTLFAAMLQKPL